MTMSFHKFMVAELSANNLFVKVKYRFKKSV